MDLTVHLCLVQGYQCVALYDYYDYTSTPFVHIHGVNRNIFTFTLYGTYNKSTKFYTVKYMSLNLMFLDHHSINHLEITNKMQPCIRSYYSVSYCLTCFEWHITHYQEIKNCIFSLLFYIRLSLLAAVERWQQPATTDVCKTRGCKFSFRAPDDEQCVTGKMLSNKKRWNNKF
jgi:hypothetical protein